MRKGKKNASSSTATPLQERHLEEIKPDASVNWIKQANNDFETLLPLIKKSAKLAGKPSDERAIFKLYSLGIVTNRDDWVYDDDRTTLATKVKFFYNSYETETKRWERAGRPEATGS